MNINKIISFSLRNHWLILTLSIILQYFSGKIMTGGILLNMPLKFYTLNRELHEILGLIIFFAALTLALEKIYLIYLRRHQ